MDFDENGDSKAGTFWPGVHIRLRPFATIGLAALHNIGRCAMLTYARKVLFQGDLVKGVDRVFQNWVRIKHNIRRWVNL